MANIFRISFLTFLLFFLSVSIFNVNAQTFRSKKGGVCFRVDDYQDTSKLRRIVQLFDKYDLKFTYATNSAISEYYGNNQYWSLLQSMYQNNHELADQTPSDASHYFEPPTASEALSFVGRNGVDHVNEAARRVCLTYNLLNTQGAGDEGKARVNGDTIISETKGEFAYSRLNNMRVTSHIFIPSLNKLGVIYSIINANANDPDTLLVQSFWKEKIDLGKTGFVDYKKISPSDLSTSTPGLQLMAEYTFAIFKRHQLPMPTTFIHPGGNHPYNSASHLKAALEPMGFSGAASYPVINNRLTDNNSNGLRQFSFQGSNFTAEDNTLDEIKYILSESYARNLVAVSINHLSSDWTKFNFDQMLVNLEQILIWIKARKIQVDTYRNWTRCFNDLFFENSSDIFPPIQNDFNGDQLIDGMQVTNQNLIDKVNGVPYNSGYCFAPDASTAVFSLNELSGISNGINTFKVSTRGGKDQFDYFNMILYMPEVNQFVRFDIPANTTVYTERTYEFFVPKGVTIINATLNYNTNKSTKAYISGFKLFALEKPTIKPKPIQLNVQHLSDPVSLLSLAGAKTYPQADLQWKIVKTSNLFDAQISNKHVLVFKAKTNRFPLGKDSIQLAVSAPNNTADTAWFYVESVAPTFCNGEIGTIKTQKKVSEIGYDWSSQFPEAGFVNSKDSLLRIKPTEDNVYTLTITKSGNLKETHTLPVKVLASAVKGYPSETKSFAGTEEVVFTLPYHNHFTISYNEMPQTEATVNIDGNNVSVKRSLSYSGNLPVKLFVHSPTCEAYYHTLIASTWATGIEEERFNTLKIYPNPGSGLFYLEGLPHDKVSYELIDMQGRVLESGNQLGNTLDLEKVKAGYYILKLDVDGQSVSRKLIKNN